jgi:hypothetical protein
MHKCHVFLTVVEKINFMTNKNKSKNQTVKCYCQFHSYVLFVLQNVFEMTHLTENNV